MRHIMLKCENHPDLRWHCKSIAVSDNGRYNGARNIFFTGEYGQECPCPGSALIAVDMADVERARAEGD